MELRRKIAKMLVRDLTQACMGRGDVRKLDVKVPCVQQFFGLGTPGGQFIENWECFMQLPGLIEKVRCGVSGTAVSVDWQKVKSDIVKPLWCGCEGVGAVEEEAFGAMQWLREQKILRGVARECEDSGVAVTSMIGREETDEGGYLYHYRVDVTNRTPQTVRLIARNLNFFDASPRLVTSVSDGLGVVGYTPLLEPGESFAWQSGCDLPTPTGRMTGHLEFSVEDETTHEKHKAQADIYSRSPRDAAVLGFMREAAVSTFTVKLPDIELKDAPVVVLKEDTDWSNLLVVRR